MKKSLFVVACGLVISAAAVSSAQSVYETGFEASGDPSGTNFSTGDLDSQGGWVVQQGTASVADSPLTAPEGTQYVNQTTNSIVRRDIAGATGDRAIVRGKYYGTGSASLSVPTTGSPIAALVGFETVDGSTFTVKAYNGDTDAFVDGSGTFSNSVWHDISLNIRYGTTTNPQTFDVSVNGQTYLTNIPFSDNSITSLSGFESHAETESNSDDLGFFSSDGDFDDDGFSDDDEFGDNTLDPFVRDPARSLAAALGTPPIVTNNQTFSNTFPGGVEHYLPIDVAGCTNIIIEAESNNGGDLQLTLFDARLRELDPSISEIRISESLRVGVTDERLSYINNSGAEVLYLRVYEEGVQTLDYDVNVTTTPTDDMFEPNQSPSFPSDVAFGSFSDLILKDDDFYRVDTTGINSIDVTVDHDFGFGQIYTLVTEPTPPFNSIFGNFNFNNNTLEMNNVDVSAYDQVVVRVFGASLVTANTYDLTINETGSIAKSFDDFPFPGAEDGIFPTRAFNAESMIGGFPALVGEKQSVTDDGFEVNDTLESVENATVLPINQDVALRLENDDWYKVPLPNGTQSVRVTASFNNSDSNIGLELIDARCLFANAGGRLRVAQSFTNTDSETVTYVNATGNEFVYVRVFDQEFNGSNTYNVADYTLRADTLDDDIYETGGLPTTPATNLPIGSKVEDLILKDDDWYRIDLTGVNTVTVSLDHDFSNGQIFLQLVNDDGVFGTLNGDGAAQTFEANLPTLTLTDVDVSGNTSAIIRVFAANRGTNFYDLTVTTNP